MSFAGEHHDNTVGRRAREGPCYLWLMGKMYLFIRHDGVQPGSYGPLEKQIKCSERERTNNPKAMPSSP
jgi:hypothetical protein